MTATYRQRYAAADNGLRFQELTYTGNFVGLDAVPDGILGDRIMKQRATTRVLELEQRINAQLQLIEQLTVQLAKMEKAFVWALWASIFAAVLALIALGVVVFR